MNTFFSDATPPRPSRTRHENQEKDPPKVAQELCERRMHRAVRDIRRDKGSVGGARQANGEENEQ